MFKIAGVYVPKDFFDKLVRSDICDEVFGMLGVEEHILELQESGLERDSDGELVSLEYEGKYQPLPDTLRKRLEALLKDPYPQSGDYLSALIRIQTDEACILTENEIIQSEPYIEILRAVYAQARIELAEIVRSEIENAQVYPKDHKILAAALEEARIDLEVVKR